MKIYFARHGESQANLLKIISNRNLPHALTDRGRHQAMQLAERLQEYSITHIYTSPLLRAVETGDIIEEHLQVTCEQADGLREFDCGIAEGRSDEDAWRLWREEYDAWVFHQDYSYQIEGGESFQQVHTRFMSFIDTMLGLFSGTEAEILCISHGGIYSVMFPWIMLNVNPEIMMKYGFDYVSLIVAELRASGLVCVEWNGTPFQII